MTIPTTAILELLPTIEKDGNTLLKFWDKGVRVYLDTTPKSSGAPFDETVYIEKWDAEAQEFEEVVVYDGANPPADFPGNQDLNEILERIV